MIDFKMGVIKILSIHTPPSHLRTNEEQNCMCVWENTTTIKIITMMLRWKENGALKSPQQHPI
jgi:hypothetical protein